MSIKSFILGFCLFAAAAGLRAEFGIPFPDIAPTTTGTAASIAIWGTTNVTEAAGNTIAVTFPSGMTVPTINVATCACIFMKLTRTDTGANWGTFSPSELTVTAGSQSGSKLTVALPKSMAPGLFYVRFDDSAAIKTPSTGGLLTFLLGDPSSNLLESRSIWVRNAAVTDTAQAEITGTVFDATSPTALAVPGAMVIATTSAAPASVVAMEWGPRASTPSAKASTSETICATAGADGKFSLKVPLSLTYNIFVVFSKLNGSVVETWKTSAVSQVVGATPASYTITPGTPTKVCDPSACPG
jgi:hypothetical protein